MYFSIQSGLNGTNETCRRWDSCNCDRLLVIEEEDIDRSGLKVCNKCACYVSNMFHLHRLQTDTTEVTLAWSIAFRSDGCTPTQVLPTRLSEATSVQRTKATWPEQVLCTCWVAMHQSLSAQPSVSQLTIVWTQSDQNIVSQSHYIFNLSMDQTCPRRSMQFWNQRS